MPCSTDNLSCAPSPRQVTVSKVTPPWSLITRTPSLPRRTPSCDRGSAAWPPNPHGTECAHRGCVRPFLSRVGPGNLRLPNARKATRTHHCPGLDSFKRTDVGTSTLLLAYSWKEFALRDGGNLLKHRRRIILWIVYVVGLVCLAIWASWRHKQEVAHRFEDSRCRQLPDTWPADRSGSTPAGFLWEGS